MTLDLTPELRSAIEAAASRYPAREAALLPVLHLVQDELGWISPEAERAVAEALGLRPIRVREAATFYSLFRTKPPGRFHLQVCVNLSCRLNGGEDLLRAIREALGLCPGETTADGRFSLCEVECLGGCDEAPCLMVNRERHGAMDSAKLLALLDRLTAEDGG